MNVANCCTQLFLFMLTVACTIFFSLWPNNQSLQQLYQLWESSRSFLPYYAKGAQLSSLVNQFPWFWNAFSKRIACFVGGCGVAWANLKPSALFWLCVHWKILPPYVTVQDTFTLVFRLVCFAGDDDNKTSYVKRIPDGTWLLLLFFFYEWNIMGRLVLWSHYAGAHYIHEMLYQKKKRLLSQIILDFDPHGHADVFFQKYISICFFMSLILGLDKISNLKEPTPIRKISTKPELKLIKYLNYSKC